jgi:mannose-1-phosphate guanylyltransferase
MHASVSLPLVEYGGSRVIPQAWARRQRASSICLQESTPAALVPHAAPTSAAARLAAATMMGRPPGRGALRRLSTITPFLVLRRGAMTKYGCSVLPAMVLCAGLGTRLRPLTHERPKPLLPVGDRSVLAHAVGVLRKAGISRVVVNAHHLPDRIRGEGEALGAAISVERDLLGTAGGLARARDLVGEGAVVVWNGDVVAEIDVAGLVRAHAEGSAQATLVVMPRADGGGNVGLDDEGRVVRMRREVFAREARSADFAGVHVVGDDLRRVLPERGCLVGDVYIPALRSGAVLRVVDYRGSWHDIGSVPSYLEANLAWLRARATRSWVAAGARVGRDVQLDDALLGEGSSAGGQGRVTRSVIWPGASASAPLDGVVVTPERIVLATPSASEREGLDQARSAQEDDRPER